MIFKRVDGKQIQGVNIYDGQRRRECEVVVEFGHEVIDMK